jgi:hypothetical protein
MTAHVQTSYKVEFHPLQRGRDDEGPCGDARRSPIGRLEGAIQQL